MVIIVLVVVVLTLAGATYGIFTRRGSGIGEHPRGGGHAGSPGVGEGTSRLAGDDEETESAFESHGTK